MTRFTLQSHNTLSSPRWLTIVALAASVSPAHAVLTDSLTIGNAKAISLGHAVTADPPGIDSVHFNPAGLVQLAGRQNHLKVVAGTFSIDMEFGDYDPVTAATVESYRQQALYDDAYYFNDAYQSKSTTEGASLMLPFFGMTDIPVLLAPPGRRILFTARQQYQLRHQCLLTDDGRFLSRRR